ncbi:uncharacterized protein PV09_03879 [Verruconis gallopava]|uniref:Zn(2)-C6 fungal-type domain-containing protein n=1 Tax=Verruconis gallopava TaxID=253628 RepID=A0A0D2AEE1_9PEZI|nr:uncharacterized protein PV09_03879 [Verruconis gallopava]KIW05363.1 hypothetical protein PV09_03879 [Verruconis gallopava]
MSRPQIGIDRLPTQRVSEKPKEAMNCKSCRKRKIKCNRLKPSCEACQIFACPCIYDAVPKKRGPKTDVLEALLKRVDGLEKRLRTDSDTTPVTEVKEAILDAVRGSNSPEEKPPVDAQAGDTLGSTPSDAADSRAPPRPADSSSPTRAGAFPSPEYAQVLLDTYFRRIHGKPYYILDEASTRQRLVNNQLPEHLCLAIFAATARYAANYAAYDQTEQNAKDYARLARSKLDIDEPSIEGLQTLMLLSLAMFQEGQGKKTYMYLSSAVAMALALNLHRELPPNVRVSASEREGRRRLFWSCYFLDRFGACGSQRPSLISDECIMLRLPTGSMSDDVMELEGDFFPNNSNLQFMGGAGNAGPCGSSMLISITRILGNTNRYLAAGGVKGDTHFPWHSMSTLSKIRQDLDLWTADTQDTFSSLETLFGQPDSVVLVVCKLIYHLIHCLIYRPFLPVDLAELSRSSQHQSWQIEATNLCFLHANAITELVEIGKASGITDWPAFVSYCVCTAGTIHVHGAHYQGQAGEVFSMSAEFLSRELQQLSELGYIWGGIQHQRDTLQTLYGAHSELVKSLATNPMRFSPVFQMEGFFERYPGYYFDGSHITLNDLMSDSGSVIQQQPQKFNTHSPTRAFQPPLNRSYSEHAVSYQLPAPASTLGSTPNRQPRKRRATVDPNGSTSATDGMMGDAQQNQQNHQMMAYQPPYISTATPQQDFSDTHFSSSLPTPATPNFSYSTNETFMQVDYSSTSSNMSQHTPSIPPDVNRYDPMLSAPAQYDQAGNSAAATPRAILHQMAPNHDHDSVGLGISTGTNSQNDVDPFLALLEQLAENEQSRGGPSELDFFLSGTS